MNVENQINRIIRHLADKNDHVAHVEISKQSCVRCYSSKETNVYYTIWTIFSEEQINQMELDDLEQEIDKKNSDEERSFDEMYQSMEDERVAKDFGPYY